MFYRSTIVLYLKMAYLVQINHRGIHDGNLFRKVPLLCPHLDYIDISGLICFHKNNNFPQSFTRIWEAKNPDTHLNRCFSPTPTNQSVLSVCFQCLPIGGHGFVLDKYTCLCRRGFYHPNRVAVNGFTSKLMRPLIFGSCN